MKIKGLANTNLTIGDIINFTCFCISIILAVVGFFLPPMGIVDNSVLILICELGFFSTVTKIPDMIKSLRNGAKIEIERGDTHITLEGEDSNGK